MNTTQIDVTFDIREDTGDDNTTAVIWGTAVPYGTEIRLGQMRETFAPGSVDADAAVGRPICWRHDEPIGKITRAENTADGLVIEAEIANTTLGRDAATLVRTGSVAGLSIGFTPVEDAWDRTRTKVTRKRAELREVSLTHQPAYATAGVGAVREEGTPMSDDITEAVDTTATDTREVADLRGEVEQLRDRVATLSVREPERRELTAIEFFQQYGETVKTRAWTDLTLDGTASDHSPMPTEVSARISLGRPTFAAIGASPLADSGMDANWIVDSVDPTVGTQTAEKTEIPSGPASGAIITAPVVTIAGGNDVSIQYIQRAHGWDLADYVARLSEMYARNTNSAVIAELEAIAANTGTIPTTLDTGALGNTLGAAAAGIVSNTGWAPNVVLCDSTTFFRFGAVAGNGYPVAGGNVGNADLASLEFRAFGLRFVCDPQLDGGAANAYVLNTRAMGIKESGPFTMQANVPSKLGVDYAIAGYLAVKALREKGVTALTNQV